MRITFSDSVDSKPLESSQMEEAAKEIARRRRKDPTLQEVLARWWQRKYNLPWNHDLFQDRTIFDLLVEFWEDYYEQKPLEAHRNADGHVQFKDTGDPLIDKWEEQIAQGIMPDFSEGIRPEDLEKIKQRAAAKSRNDSMPLTFKDTMDTVASKIQEAAAPSISTFGDGDGR